MAKTTTVTRGLEVGSEEEDRSFKGKNYLFVIGIDAYKHWDNLNCAVKDIEDFTDVLLDRYEFEKENVLSLKNSEATRRNILIKLREITQKITTEDNLILYFSGHGHYDKVTESGFWIPFDAEQGYQNEDDFLDTATIVHKLKAIDTRHTFLIVDACFSGTLMTQIRSAPKDEHYKSRKIFTSGRAEVVEDGPIGGNSPFAEGLLITLRKNTNPYLRASKLIVDVKEYVRNKSQQIPVDGTWFSSGHEGGDYFFHLRLEEKEYWKMALKEHNVETYEKYVNLFPDGKHLKEAKKAIKKLKEGSRGPGPDFYAWLKLQKKATYRDYLNFTETFPDSQFVEEATREMQLMENVALNKLKIMEAKASVSKADKINACNAYFKNFPKSRNELEVRQIRNRLNLLG